MPCAENGKYLPGRDGAVGGGIHGVIASTTCSRSHLSTAVSRSCRARSPARTTSLPEARPPEATKVSIQLACSPGRLRVPPGASYDGEGGWI